MGFHRCNKLVLLLSTLIVLTTLIDRSDCGILFPQESEKRQLNSLDGLWNFRTANRSNQEEGFVGQWYTRPLEKTGPVIWMPVPSSYNDITQDAAIRDHIGWAWYDREFFVADYWSNSNVFVRFGSANYHAIVWINGQQVVEHAGGYLPFQADISSRLLYGNRNRITVAINNTLTESTLPQGAIKYATNMDKYPPGFNVQNYDFDWLNFAGIHRPVYLYTVPKTAYVDDVNVTTSLASGNSQSFIEYSVGTRGTDTGSVTVDVTIFDKDGNQVTSRTGESGLLSVTNPRLWWPRGMTEEAGYLYTFQVQIKDRSSGTLIDSYRLRIGIRAIDWDANGVYINGRKIYFKGFGRHEDAILRGRGLDRVTLVKDFNLMQWTGANSFRTSHYPYSEELMDLADEQGFMIIDEVAACTMRLYGDQHMTNHKAALTELYLRDKNRPSVVMWSVANEADTDNPLAGPYFREIADFARKLEGYRPITNVIFKSYDTDITAQYFDVICINRYFGWYDDAGILEIIFKQVTNDVYQWWNKYKKPVLMTEYGADTVDGFHQDPSHIWTEDYQVDFMTEYFKAFDDVYQKGYFIGEMIWNFADFATKQDVKRAIGNRKGIFTRDRQPKASAKHLKQRYTNLGR